MSIYLEKINMSYNNRTVLQDFSLTIEKGKFNALMGPSGVGKTTVINLLLGLIEPDSGRISGLEEEVLSAVFQEDRLIESYSGLNNILLACKKSGQNSERAEKLLNYAGLGEHSHKPVCQLSGGMRRRAAIIRGIIKDHSFLILDEPFRGMDKEIKIKIMDLILEEEKNKTVLLVTHNEEEAEYLNCIKNNIGKA